MEIIWWLVWTAVAIGSVLLFLLLSHIYFKQLTLGRYKITQDLRGKVIIVTGASGGIGKETSRELAKHGATVYMACRSVAKAEKIAQEMRAPGLKGKLIVMQLNLTSFSSVRKFVDEFKARENRLDVLINNAGIGAPSVKPGPVLTEDGIEEIMQTNHFGHFLLTMLLLDLLKRSTPSRIVSVSSELHRNSSFDVDKPPCFLSDNFSALRAYNSSKLCNILFTTSLARRLYGSGVTANCLHPGVVMSELSMDGFQWISRNLGAILSKLFFKTTLEGAQTSLFLALSPEIQHVNGVYFSDCKQKQPTRTAQSEQLAEKLWAISEKLTGLEESGATLPIRLFTKR